MSDSGRGSLKGKTALVTGAGGGIGRACAIALAHEGARVIAVDVDESALRDLAKFCGAEIMVADLSAPERFFPDNLEVDILVNNAGIQHVSPIENFPLDKADFMLSLMLRTPFYLIQKSLPYMYEKQWGRVIGISSLHGQVASPYKSIYVMAKHAMEGLHKVLSLEGGPHGVTANTIAPAYVRTALVDKQIDDQARVNKISRDQVIDEIMLAPAAIKRLIEPEEVAAMVLYLCGPNANSMTGSAIPMDNGWMAR